MERERIRNKAPKQMAERDVVSEKPKRIMNVGRRNFINSISLVSIGATSFLVSGFSLKNAFKRKRIALLPTQGKTISIETALNSRCSSDSDGQPKKFHWGVFDDSRKLADADISSVLEAARVPSFSRNKVTVHSKDSILTFHIDRKSRGIEREWAMVESGMQQQGVFLACAGLGVGIRIHNMGKDGTPISDSDYGTIRVELKAMSPSFNGSYWSNLPPLGERDWQPGNLPDPDRDGGNPLMSSISNLKSSHIGSAEATDKTLSQLLWAARGRTPHYYMSTPWGLTIPTWAGLQGITSVYLASKREISAYINWQNDHPTHSLRTLKNGSVNEILDNLDIKDIASHCIILGANERSGRALWEVGYQLENLLLQATSLDLSYKATLLDKNQRRILHKFAIRGATALFSVH